MPEHRKKNCPENPRNSSDHAKEGANFLAKYAPEIPFHIDCLECCYDYLMMERNYKKGVWPFNRIQFTDRNEANVPGFVRLPGKSGQNGQISIDNDLSLGNPCGRSVEQSRTFQLYNEGEADLTMGLKVNARMESMTIDEVKIDEISSIHLTYADAALIELYRSGKKMPALPGFCNLIDVGKLSLYA